jgi:hypothetical protein
MPVVEIVILSLCGLAGAFGFAVVVHGVVLIIKNK